MTSISSLSSAASIVSYSPSLDKNGDGVVSADELAAASAAGTQTQSQSAAQPSDDDGSGSAASGAAAKFVSLLMQLLMQLQNSDPSQSAQSDQSGQADASGQATGKPDGKHSPLSVADLDTDGDGSVSAAEFAAAKPDNVTDEQSADFFAKLDKDGNGALDETELQAMQHGGHAHGAHGHHGGGGGPDLADLDSDGDGSVTQAEFSAGKPDDVTDDQSTQLFSSLDTDGNGILDANELKAAQNDNNPSATTPASGNTGTDGGDLTKELDDVLQQLQRFAQQFFDEGSDASSLVPADA